MTAKRGAEKRAAQKTAARLLEEIDPATLRVYERNSRAHSDEQIAAVAKSIAEFGFTNPILITNGKNPTIIAGHARVKAAVLLGMKSVPCVRLPAHLTPAQIRAYVIADNSLALAAEWDFSLLSMEVEELAQSGFDIQMLGFSDKELARIEKWGANAQEGGGGENQTVGGGRHLLQVEFDSESALQEAFDEMQRRQNDGTLRGAKDVKILS